MKKNAFTLIELLVVIVIIGVLAAILVPTVMSAKKRVLVTSCQSKLKQMMIACQKWSTDNNDSWILQDYVNNDWPLRINPYLTDRKPNETGGEFRCPAGDAAREYGDRIVWQWVAIDYGALDQPDASIHRYTDVKDTTKQATFIDFLVGFSGLVNSNKFVSTMTPANLPSIYRHPSGRTGAGNAVYLDSHVSLYPYKWVDLVAPL